MADNKDRHEITMLLMAQADRDRRFSGSISRGQDVNGIPVIPDRIDVNNGFVCAQAGNQDALGSRLDELVKMVIDAGMHDNQGVTSTVAGFECCLN
jgi:hypothetical protein